MYACFLVVLLLKPGSARQSFLQADNSASVTVQSKAVLAWPVKWPWSTRSPPCVIERRSDGSCPLKGCELEEGSDDIAACANHPELGLGECPVADVRRISNVLHNRQQSDADAVTLIREMGTNPVYHDMRWADHAGRRLEKSPPGKGWTMLHKQGLFSWSGFISRETADSIVSSLSDLPQHGSGIYHGNYVKCEFRKSTTWDISQNLDVLPSKLRSRIASASGAEIANFELTQAVRYRPGEFYSEHLDEGPCDHFNNGSHVQGMDSKSLKKAMLQHNSCDGSVRRDGTFLLYLTDNDEHDGGATYFPRLGIRVPATKGNAIFFRPTFPDGTVDPMLLHAAEVMKSGAKFVIQQWITNPSLPVDPRPQQL